MRYKSMTKFWGQSGFQRGEISGGIIEEKTEAWIFQICWVYDQREE